MSRESHEIGQWTFDVAAANLRAPEGDRRLEDRAARTLALLCHRRGEVVTHADIVNEVWQGRSISPNSVAVVIGDLRRALGDNARQPRYIATVAKRGYRLISEPQAATVHLKRGPMLAAAAVAAVAALAAAAAVGAFARSEPRMAISIEPVRNDTGQAGYDRLSRALGELEVTQLSKSPKLDVRPLGGQPSAGPRLTLKSKLILWNGQPTLSLQAIDPASGSVVWAKMAQGPADDLADNMIESLHGLNAKLAEAPKT